MFLRRLRGLLGAAMIWALAWVPLGVAFGIRRWLRTPWGDFLAEGAVPARPAALPIVANTVAFFLIWGALVGLVFALALLSAERKGAIQNLSGRRLMVWGALAAVIPPLGIMVSEMVQSRQVLIDWSLLLVLLISAGWGALCAAGMLRVARGNAGVVAA